MSVEQLEIDTNRNLLGISNTLVHGRPPLDHVINELAEMFSGIHQIVYVPYAYTDMDKIIGLLKPSFEKVGVSTVVSPHHFPGSELQVIDDAAAIFIGGGNTGRLIANLHALRNDDGLLVDGRPDASQSSLIEVLRKKVAEGIPFVGSSAGTNAMCTDIRTTNDMQSAVWEKEGQKLLRIDALGLLPPTLSINPHYQDVVAVTEEEREALLAIKPDLAILLDHQGETRQERINQVMEKDRGRKVLALREGSFVSVSGAEMVIGGTTGGIIFEYSKDLKPVNNGDRLDFLLVQ